MYQKRKITLNYWKRIHFLSNKNEIFPLQLPKKKDF